MFRPPLILPDHRKSDDKLINVGVYFDLLILVDSTSIGLTQLVAEAINRFSSFVSSKSFHNEIDMYLVLSNQCAAFCFVVVVDRW